MWNAAFVAHDVRILIRRVKHDGVYDMDSIRSRYKLSTRESEVMDLLLRGKRYRDIGEELYISKATVKTYIIRIYQKTEVHSRIQLVNKLLTSV